MHDGLIRIAAVAPATTIAAPEKNADAHIQAIRTAAEDGAHIVVFPELSLSTYAVGDLVTHPRMLSSCEETLVRIAEETKGLQVLAFLGVPVRVGGCVYSCAAAVFGGRLVGLVPGSHVSRGPVRGISPYAGETITIRYAGAEVPFGTRQLFTCDAMPSLVIAAELGADFSSPVPPSCDHTAAGATVVVCLAAQPELIGAAARRRTLVEAHAARTACAYLLANAGESESGTDGIYAAHEVYSFLGRTARESVPFGDGYLAADVDTEMILFERTRRADNPETHGAGYTVTAVPFAPVDTPLRDPLDALPFVPSGDADTASRCELILNIQARALAHRMQRAYAKTLVFGASGGLDSTLALLVCIRALASIGHDPAETVAITMPCFGTTARTRSNAERLAVALGATFMEVDIKRAVDVHFADIGHDPEDHSVVYENAQARERTQVLMDVANKCGGLVVGTGDISELALGWATYNGDHMSMYGVNAGVPKTLMRHLVRYEAETLDAAGNHEAASVLRDILATPVSPELLPPKDGEIAQCTEGIVGPYELHDFFLYYTVRWGFMPHKILRYARHAFAGTYDEETIRGWLTIFVRRFFAQQFKRSCLADGPAVGTVSLSPRGAWCMPSDASSAAWLEDLK